MLELIRTKKLKISNLAKDAIGPATIDLTLDKKIRVFNAENQTFDITSDTDYKTKTKVLDISKGYLLKPNELVLGITKEKITLPNNIAGWLNSRSTFARLGLMSHITAPFISPGVNNKQVLEIYNASNHIIKLKPGIKICHLVLQECKGEAQYTGKYQGQAL